MPRAYLLQTEDARCIFTKTAGARCIFTKTAGARCIFTKTAGARCIFTKTANAAVDIHIRRQMPRVCSLKTTGACPSMCTGDGEPGTSTTRDEILDMVFSNKDVVQRPR